MMIMGLIVTYCLCFASLKKLGRGRNNIEPLVISFLFINIIIFTSTELLSIPHALTSMNITIVWLMSSLLGAFVWLLLPEVRRHDAPPAAFPLDLTEILLLSGISCICLFLFFKTVFSAPFSNDVLIYHLPRVMHWIQNKTAAPYPTHILRQLFNPALSGYFQMHLYLLSGGDRFCNFPQYISMLLNLCCVSMISSLLGLNRTENLLAVFLAAFLPSGILIAPTALNDYSVSLWVSGLVLYALKYIENNKTTDLSLAIAFLSSILLTKIHPLLTAAPFILVLLIKAFRRKPSLFVIALIFMLTMICLNWSKMITSIDIMVSSYIFSAFVQISIVHPKWGLFENVLRHLITQSSFFRSDEDNPTDPLHTMLIISFLIYFLFNRNKLSPLIQKYTFLLSSGILLSLIVLKASIWTGRFNLAGYVLFCPLIALFLCRFRALLLPCALFIFICGIYIVLFFSPKSLLGHSGIMHTPRHAQIPAFDKPSSMFLEAAEDIPRLGCDQIGLIYKNHIYQREYIIWQTLKEKLKNFRLEHVDVDNPSGRLDYPLGAFTPCAVIQATTGGFTDTIQVKNDTLKLYKQYNRYVGLYISDKRSF